ncbi:hypothetical protein LSUE1_G003604 [Lachnellula suecica]|uniref:SET domain-containing protein n=1 Tax=Lachnellula suecica TaxID=602035 RepID=A0A8T9CLJ5_9HELO|nr:hypothetical protein LSUE1_G003604 [Lachnellula suecica]
MSSAMDPSDPSYEQVVKILKLQKTATQNAFQRKGERPRDLPSRAECVKQFTMASLSVKMQGMQTGHMMMTTVIGTPYHPSTASLKDLKKVMIKDLTLETNHRGSYLLLRFICPAMRMSAVMNIVEDEAGTVMPFALYMQEPESFRTAASILKDKSTIILKEPYFKVGTNGQKWRIAGATVAKSADDWKKKGNDFVGKRIQELCNLLLRHRKKKFYTTTEPFLAYELKPAFDAALKDVSFILNPEVRSEKGLYRGALALYGLGKYKEALGVLQILVRKYPESAPGKHEFERTRLRVAEQESGIYDWKALYKATKLRPPRMDNATYKGPIEVRESKGRGRGLFITRAVKAGELLLCEKAFSYSFAAPPGEMADISKSMSQSSVLMDVPENRISRGTHADIIRDISNKLVLNPSLAASFENLFHGEYDGGGGILVDGTPVVDTFLVAKTIHQNCFGCPLTSRDAVYDPELARASNHKYTEQHQKGSGTTGIWILASYINHSCNPNCRRSFIGDLQIVRAARDMAANTEIMFPYIDGEEPGTLNKKLSKGWRFQCDCALCTDQTTPA